MRADRLLSIVLLLQTHHQLSSRELAQRLEVSERTIHRDMEALSCAGIPVVAERGSAGGWSLLGQYRTNLTGLNESEIQSLFLTPSPKLLSDLKLQKASEGALLKLLAALPAMHRSGAERARRRIYVDSAGWARTDESVPQLPSIQDAIWSERKIRITYERGPGCEAVERELDPLGLVAKGSAWYLVGAVDGSLRSYRISRISQVSILEQPSVTPVDFDLANYWRESASTFKATLPKYQAIFRVSPTVFPRLHFAGRFARVGEVIETSEDGWISVSVGFDVEEMACEYALGFGENLQVVEPESLKWKVLEAAKRVVEMYVGRVNA
jgi:predicted DNA-binding transcriptional regulator YafY